MPSIYLGKQSGTYSTQTFGGVTVTVSEQSYDKSNLFRKYKHQLRTPTGGNIYIYKQSYYIVWYNYATLQPGTEYQNAKLQSADVYFNSFDTAKPLVLVLHFKKDQEEQAESAANGGGGSNGQTQKLDDMYWKYSEFSSEIDGNSNMNINTLKEYKKDSGDDKLLEELIKENDLTNESLTYDLHEKGNGDREKTYRDGKISVSKQDVKGQTGGTQVKFYKHTHKPVNGDSTARKSYILYDKNVLMKSSSEPLKDIQGQQYSGITVYFSNTDNNPLLIELENVGQKTYLKRIIGGSDNKLLWAKDKQAESTIGKGGDDKVVEHLEQIVISLDNKIYVSLDKQAKYGQSELNGLKGPGKTEFKLSKYQPEKIEVDGGQELKNGVESDSQQTIQYKKYTHSITVDNSTLSDVPEEVKRQAEFELIPSIAKVTIPIYESGGVGTGTRATLTFKQNGSSTQLSTELKTQLYVYFYNHPSGGDGPSESPDTVPLMLEHKGEFYGPSGVSSYFTGWHKIDKITGDDTLGITGELDTVNKLLNEVNIEKTTNGRRESSYGIEKPLGRDTQLGGFSTDRVTVKCGPVGGGGGGACPSPPGPPTGDGCTPSPYIKYIHTTVNRYELGKIKYQGQEVKVVGEDGRNGGTEITVKPGYNLLEVYYMTDDTDRKYPLLIGIGKQPGSGGGASTYYKLKTTGTGSPKDYRWEQDLGARSQMSSNAVKYLNEINYQVKKVLKLEIDKRVQYPAKWSRSPGKTSGGFEKVPANGVPNGNNQIQVEDCNSQCTALTSHHYKCFRHKLSGLGDNLNEVGGISLTLPGVGRDKVVEIKLHNSSDGKCQNGTDTQVTPLVYNSCMGDVYVFFYDKGGGGDGNSVDSVPLMLWYNNKYYRPNTRKEYFEKWVCVPELAEQGKKGPPCGEDNGKTLAGQLDIVNKALNVIELDKSGTGKGYGLPTQAGVGVQVDTHKFPTDRVTVSEKKPTSPYASTTYTRVIHRTTNGFEIGEINYATQDFTGYGVNLGLGASIKVKGNGGRNNNHKKSVSTYNWNTVVCYYSNTDSTKKLPQLIVILKTDKEVDSGTDVKGSGEKYGYYILTNSSTGGSGSEYVWRTATGGVTLDDQTDFTLLNSIVVLINRKSKGNYSESEISGPIKTAKLKSPGQSSDINRLTIKDKNISVTDQTAKADGQCVKDYGYKLFTHYLGDLGTSTRGVSLILGIRLLIPCGTQSNGQTQYKQLQLCKDPVTMDTQGGSEHYLYYNRGSNNVYVYFYGNEPLEEPEDFYLDFCGSFEGDPRPLLLCYNKNAYRPNGTSYYDSKWVNEMSIRQCECTGRGGRNDELLTTLTYVVGFLNTVNLFKRPGGGDCNGASGVPTTECTESNGDTSGNTCKYEVHKYQGKPIKVKVTCSKIQSSDEATTAQAGCYYWEFKHTPNGINGVTNGSPGTNGAQPAKGFRLGTVEYKGTTSIGNGVGSRTGSVDYTSSSYKYYPLVKVTTYYYSEDTGFTKPLLVVLEFRVKGSSPGPPPPGPPSSEKEYYKLKLESGDSGSGLSWTDDTSNAKSKVGDDRDSAKLVLYLDSIRFGLMKVVQIEIQKNKVEKYELKGGTSKQSTKDYKPLPGDGAGTKKIEVAECKNCEKLGDYKCFVHKLKDQMTGLENEVGGIKLTIPGSGPTGDVEIPLHRKSEGGGDGNGSNNYEPITPLTYNKCMGDIYVYFYNKGGGKSPGSPDTVPLMLVYNNKFYKPQNRDQYFKKWVPVDGLESVKPGEGKVPCGGDGATKLVTQLDIVNRELNRIDLDQHSARGGKYGLPDPSPPAQLNKGAFPTERVTVVERAPTDPNARSTYTRIVHRTVNGFTVGKLTSKGGENDITSEGFEVTGGEATIRVNGGSGGRTSGKTHTSFTNNNKLNTVVVYYSETDKTRALPQLIVLLHTGEAIKPGGSEGGGQGEITGSGTQTKYGYYIIAIKQGGGGDSNGYEYVWVKVTDSTPAKQLVLNDATDFNLLNSVVILLEQRGTSGGTSSTSKYGDGEIQKAVKAAIAQGMPKSPGQPEQDVNRLTGEKIKIEVKDNTKTEGKCLEGTGFKLITHNISALVNLNESLSTHLQGVTLIGGLRFLIPTRESGSYKQLTLKDNSEKPGGGLIMYHQPGRGDNNKVCVFFYQGIESASTSNTGSQSNQGDPRPLLMCYANEGYTATSMEEYDKQVWVKDKDVTDCKCDSKSGGGEQILKKLVEVSNFLNPVHLEKTGMIIGCVRFYIIHSFNGNGIFINIDYKKGENGFCYDRYTHTPTKGFRLGEIRHGTQCIKENSGDTSNDQCITAVNDNSRPFTPSPEVVTYYYKGDKKYKNPLLVALCKKAGENGNGTCTYQPYYELQRPEPGGAKEAKKYKKQDSSIDLKETVGSDLETILNNILNRISKKLQIILSERPMAKIKCIEIEVTEKDKKENQHTSNCLERTKTDKNGGKEKINYPCGCVKEEDAKSHPKASDTGVIPPFYEGQLYENTGKKVENGNGKSHYNIGVEEMKCDALTSRGYRCYKHKLTEVVGIEEVGGLKLFLWKGQGEENQFNLYQCKNNGENGEKKLDPVTYNTCKGDIYVYFYGEDLRPLMLCYAGNAYRAKDKGSYEKSWVCVKDVENKCQCGEPEFQAEQVLTQLYKLSMDLNEVDLGQTKEAYDSKTRGTKPGGHKYKIHEYNNTEVRVSVTGHDLSCYKQYTHRPEKGGYRLGRICYNPESPSSPKSPNEECTPATGITYSSYKQLISVSLYYYMYDRAHNWPLIIQLTFKDDFNEYFRLNDGRKGHKKWEKITSNKQPKCPNDNASPPGEQAQNGITQNDENKELDKIFAEAAADLECKIYNVERGIPWYPSNYKYLMEQLHSLIELRAYDVRTKLKLKYINNKHHLILATDENCHEESVMGYVIGGGAVGVAGGGGWKAVSVM